MRRFGQQYASASIMLVAAAYSGIALASLAAVWSFGRTFDELRRGGGIDVISRGLWQASRLPLASAWLTIGISMVALAAMLFARRSDETRPAASPWLAAVAIAAGVGAVVLFRALTSFLLDVSIPERQPASWLTAENVDGAVRISFLVAGAGCVACFLTAIALAVVSSRRRAERSRFAVVVLVVSLVAAAALAANLSAFSRHWRSVALEGHPIASRISSIVVRRHVYIGVSRTVYFDDSVSRSSCTRSRNSSAVSDSNATTKS